MRLFNSSFIGIIFWAKNFNNSLQGIVYHPTEISSFKLKIMAGLGASAAYVTQLLV